MYRAAEFVLTEMKRATQEAGAILVVVYLPFYYSSRVEDAPTEMVSVAQKLNIPFISLTNRFNELQQGGTRLSFPNDGHLNEIGNAAIADEIFRFLERSNIVGRGADGAAAISKSVGTSSP
jgi:hypothetical protein